MIPFPLRSLFKNKKAAWLARHEAKLQAEFAPQIASIHTHHQAQLGELQRRSEQLQDKVRESEHLWTQLADQEKLLLDRRIAVEKANEELRVQLRLIEAKAAPDRVWVEAFSQGYQMAWQTVWPIMAEGVQNLKTVIEQKAIEETISRLTPALHLRESQELLKKREEFLLKQKSALSQEEKVRYSHYLTALDWMLNADGLHQNQPAA